MIHKIICVCLAVSMAIVVPLASYADGYSRNGAFRQQYNQHQNFNQNITKFNIVDEVDVVQKRVQFDADYFLGLDGYYSVINELQAQEYQQDQDIILKQSQQVDKLISLLQLSLQQKQTHIPQSHPDPSEEPKTELPEDVGKDENEGKDAGVVVPESPSALNNRVFEIFKQSCVSCHGQSSPKAGLQLIGEDPDGTEWLNDLSLSDRVDVYDVTSGTNLRERGKKLMPLGGPPLSDEEVEILKLWMIEKAELK